MQRMNMSELSGRLRALLDKGKNRTGLMIVLAAAAALLVIFSGSSGAEQPQSAQQSATAEDYARELEQRLESIISSMEGVGEAHVLITLQNGKEYIYAVQDSTSTDSSASTDPAGRQSSDESRNSQSSYIILDTDSGEQALVCTELMPAVSGVVVVCRGGDDPLVAEQITAVVTTALDISSKRVCITKLSQ